MKPIRPKTHETPREKHRQIILAALAKASQKETKK